METKVMRDMRDGIQASTSIPLLDADNHVLRVTTLKANRGIVCTARAVQEHNGWISFVVFEDFFKPLVHEPTARATEKTIREIHARGLVGIETVLAEARAMYARPSQQRQNRALEAEHRNIELEG